MLGDDCVGAAPTEVDECLASPWPRWPAGRCRVAEPTGVGECVGAEPTDVDECLVASRPRWTTGRCRSWVYDGVVVVWVEVVWCAWRPHVE